jgi:hypothetical protein
VSRPKVCKKCGDLKPLSDFHGAAGMRDRHRSECKSCHAVARKARYAKDPGAEIRRVQRWRDANYDRYMATQRAYKRANKARLQKQHRDRHLRKNYGIVSEEFDLLVLAQLNLCAICLRYFGKQLHVDHDHTTGRIRGLLCGKCNKAIGLLDDRPQRADAAAKYLRRAGNRLSSGA